jgi:glucokinase
MKSQKFCDCNKTSVQNRTKKKRSRLERSKFTLTIRAITDGAMVQHKIVVADIGGTNARFQAWSIHLDHSDALDFEKIYQTKDYPQFTDVFQQFVKDSGVKFFDAGCFAVAGPVSENRCKMTNLGWDICADSLLEYVKADKISIINDFVANGYGVLELDQKDLFTLNETPVRVNGPIAVLGPGTGLGEALLFPGNDSNAYTIYPTEGSHADFAPRGGTQRALLEYMENLHGSCEVEQVCCGYGLVNIYNFLCSSQKTENVGDLTPEQITKNALAGSCPLSLEAVDIFLSILGAEAANLGLKSLATGGIYITGGIIPRLLPLLNRGYLLEAYLSRGSRFHDLRSSFPLWVVTTENLGLSGALVFS